MNMLKIFFNYTMAYFFTMFLIVYLLKIPFKMKAYDGDNDLVKEYYIDNYIKYVIFDYFLVLVYILFAYTIIWFFDIKSDCNKILIVILTTIIISSSFGYYFINSDKTSSFFSRWFHTVGYLAVLYDVILVGTAYIVYNYMNNTV